MDWKNRIVSYGTKPADQFQAHPNNPRIHPKAQRTAVKGSLETLGWVKPVIELTSGYLLDGHERVWQALQSDNAEVPYIVVDLSENEANIALASLDFITEMATYDGAAVERLLHDVNTTNASMQQVLADIAEKAGLITADLDTPQTPSVDRSVQCPQCGEIFTA